MLYADVPGIGPCSRLALGTMDLSPERMEQATSLLDAFLAAGGNVIDTAFVYGGGQSERAIGQWLRASGARDRVVILDKGAHPDEHGPRVTPECIAADLAENLRRLGVETIDLYMLHRDDPAVPVGPIVEALNAHRRAGRIREFGGSNWSTERLDAANAYAAEHGLRGFVASSPNLSLAVANEPRWAGCHYVRTPQELAWYRERQFPLFSWSSQASGFFTGRFRPEVRDHPDVVRVYYSDTNWERLRRAQALAADKGATANQVALAWVLRQPFPTFPLIGPLSVDELRSSLGVLDVDLTPAQAAWLNLEGERP